MFARLWKSERKELMAVGKPPRMLHETTRNNSQMRMKTVEAGSPSTIIICRRSTSITTSAREQHRMKGEMEKELWETGEAEEAATRFRMLTYTRLLGYISIPRLWQYNGKAMRWFWANGSKLCRVWRKRGDWCGPTAPLTFHSSFFPSAMLFLWKYLRR